MPGPGQRRRLGKAYWPTPRVKARDKHHGTPAKASKAPSKAKKAKPKGKTKGK